MIFIDPYAVSERQDVACWLIHGGYFREHTEGTEIYIVTSIQRKWSYSIRVLFCVTYLESFNALTFVGHKFGNFLFSS